jgi:hypothetical protein
MKKPMPFRYTLAVVALVSMLACDDGMSPTEPSPGDLTGAWTGTSTYPNAPFQLDLSQTDRTLRGQYRDRLDTGISVTGTLSSSTVAIVVDFGDAKLNLEGTVTTARRVQGTMFTSALGNTRYPFTMTR